MGTNYYWHDRPCEHCGRYEDIHVGKSQHTWRAYFHALLDDEHPDWGYQDESPFGFPVLSLADWRRVFNERPGELWDEYGRRINDPLAWLAEAKPWQPGPDGWKYLDEDIRSGRGWLDGEKYRFHAGEFS
jgi:hypothetical protein